MEMPNVSYEVTKRKRVSKVVQELQGILEL